MPAPPPPSALRRPTVITTVALVLLVVVAIRWVGAVPGMQTHLDFAPYWASASLLREGHAAGMYDTTAQAALLRASGNAPQGSTVAALAQRRPSSGHR